MIPVRIPATARPALASVRRITIAPGHPLHDALCPVCDESLGGVPAVLVLAGTEPGNRKPAGWTNGAAVAVHAACAGVPGEEPAAAVTELTGAERIKRAVEFIKAHEYTDGAHHKQWVLNQVLLILTNGAGYLEDEGIAP